MSHKVNLVRVLTAATGNSTPITLGAAYSQLFMTPAEAGAMDGRVYTYLLVDGNNWEIGKGAYTASGTTLARTTILASRIAGTLGTARISLSGTAQVRFIESAEDMDGVRGTRAVTGTSDTINNSDLGYVLTYNNASAVAASLAQASVSNLFIDGWAVWVKNKGAGAVTITPATSTIDGAATLVLQQNHGALIWSDGTNYQSLRLRGDLGDSATKNVGTTAGTVAAGDDARFTPFVLPGYIHRLTVSTPGGTGLTVAAGTASDSAASGYITLASSLTKNTGSWAVGISGALDTGTIATGTYHVYLIKRPDTGVVDWCLSASASAPTTGGNIPAAYTKYRRILSILVTSTAPNLFVQEGNTVLYPAPIQDVNGAEVGTTSLTPTLSVPTGIKVEALTRVGIFNSASIVNGLMSSPDETSISGGSLGFNRSIETPAASVAYFATSPPVRTNTSGQVRFVVDAASSLYYIATYGYIDRRGQY